MAGMLTGKEEYPAPIKDMLAKAKSDEERRIILEMYESMKAGDSVMIDAPAPLPVEVTPEGQEVSVTF